MLGTILFPDKSGDCVPREYLNLLGNLETVSEYAWGAAVLAYMYYHLGMASQYDAAQISGYITLFEVF